MVNQKLTSLDEETSIDDADILYVVTNVATTPTSKKMTKANFAAGLGGGTIGTHQFWIPASAFKPTATTPAAGLTTREFGAQSQNVEAMEFTSAADSLAYVNFVMPQNWNISTIKFKVYHFREDDEATPESKTVSFDMDGVALSNEGALGGTAYGTAITVTDTYPSSAAEDKIIITDQSAVLTINGTPADFDYISLRLKVDITDGTTSGSAFVTGVMIEYTTDADLSVG